MLFFELILMKIFLQLKERSQEVRRLRADVANANLKADKISAEKDRFEKEIEEVRQSSKLGDEETESLRSKLSELESVRKELNRIKEEVDIKDSEIEDKIRENEVLKVIRVFLNTISLLFLYRKSHSPHL
jgi:chromosome segregation ATPase